VASLLAMSALALGGFAAGVINTLAGGGSLLTVPLLVLLGLPGALANGTNRIGILVQNAVAAWRFRAEGVRVFRETLPVLAPVSVGSVVGAVAISRLADQTFERAFGLLMLALLIPTLREAGGRRAMRRPARPWPPAAALVANFAVGLYGGAFQAGVGLALLAVLAREGHDLVRANAIKVIVVGALTAVAVPVFVLSGAVAWGPALALAAGYAAGGALGARLAVRGGERVIRAALALAVVALAGRMLGLY